MISTTHPQPAPSPSMPLVDNYLNHLCQALQMVSRQDICTLIEILFAAWVNQQHIYICGNGGSAATASHMVNDLNKLTLVPGKPRFKATALTDNVPLITAWANDHSYADVFSQQLENFIQPGDVLIAISTSGESENVLRAVQVARDHQAIIVGLTGQNGGRLKASVQHCVCIPAAHLCQQEDGHLILDHIISLALRQMITEYQTPHGDDQ